MSRSMVAALTVALAASAACASRTGPGQNPPYDASSVNANGPAAVEMVTVEVSNHNWLDVVIYVVHGGHRTRLMTVVAAGAGSAVLPSHTLRSQGQIRLLAHAVGKPETFLSESIVAKSGMTIDWTLETDLRRSSLAVW